jgi:transcriptional regulator with XRE-family HTH domain
MRNKKFNWLAFFRVKNGLTQKKLAEISGVSHSIIAKIEIGKMIASKNNIEKLLRALNSDTQKLSVELGVKIAS